MNLKSFLWTIVILSNSAAIRSVTSTTVSPDREQFLIIERIQFNLHMDSPASSILQKTTVIPPDSTVTQPPKSENLKEYYKPHPDTISTNLKKHKNDPFKMPIVKIPDQWQSNMPVMVPDSTVSFTLKIITPKNK